LRNADLTSARFIQAELDERNGERTMFRSVTMESCLITNGYFKNASLVAAHLRKCNLPSAVFTEAVLANIRFEVLIVNHN
jgi:uncharacterized protein YjbI with pentapeptide repeats